jgi:hypothetical protein
LSQTIGEIFINDREKYVVTLDKARGKTWIDIRYHYKAGAGNWLPTNKGINMDTETWPEFKKLIEKVDKAINEIS